MFTVFLCVIDCQLILSKLAHDPMVALPQILKLFETPKLPSFAIDPRPKGRMSMHNSSVSACGPNVQQGESVTVLTTTDKSAAACAHTCCTIV